MDLRDLQWLAGLLEGEGTFLRPVPSAPRCPSIRLEMCDRDIVVRVARSWRRAVVSIRPRRLGHRTSYVTTIKGRPAIRLMLELAPFMSGIRRRAIRRAIRRIGPVVFPASSWSPSLPWLAGLLEGEGTFTARRNGTWVGISVEMSDRTTVHRVASMLGASSIHRDKGRPELGWRPTFVAHISGNRARPWLLALRPWMGERRGAAIDLALDSWTPTRLWPAPASCVVPACGKPHRARGLCHTHYMRWSRARVTGTDPGFQALR